MCNVNKMLIKSCSQNSGFSVYFYVFSDWVDLLLNIFAFAFKTGLTLM